MIDSTLLIITSHQSTIEQVSDLLKTSDQKRHRSQIKSGTMAPVPPVSPGYRTADVLQVVCPPAAPALLAGAGVVGDCPWNCSFADGFSGLTTFLSVFGVCT